MALIEADLISNDVGKQIIEIGFFEGYGAENITIDIKEFTNSYQQLTEENFMVQPLTMFSSYSVGPHSGWQNGDNTVPFFKYDNNTGILTINLHCYSGISNVVGAGANLCDTKIFMVI